MLAIVYNDKMNLQKKKNIEGDIPLCYPKYSVVPMTSLELEYVLINYKQTDVTDNSFYTCMHACSFYVFSLSIF